MSDGWEIAGAVAAGIAGAGAIIAEARRRRDRPLVRWSTRAQQPASNSRTWGLLFVNAGDAPAFDVQALNGQWTDIETPRLHPLIAPGADLLVQLRIDCKPGQAYMLLTWAAGPARHPKPRIEWFPLLPEGELAAAKHATSSSPWASRLRLGKETPPWLPQPRGATARSARSTAALLQRVSREQSASDQPPLRP